jgi:16S rRNA processing protein RimM
MFVTGKKMSTDQQPPTRQATDTSATRSVPRAKPLPVSQKRLIDAPEGYLAVGYVVGVHGLLGEVKVELYTDFPERFSPGTQLFVGETLEKRKVTSVRPHKHYLLLRLNGITRREQADELRGQWLFVAEEDAVVLDDGTYFVHEIIGMDVVTSAGRALGTITEVIFTGANEVYVIEPAPGVNRDKELLLPAIQDVIRQVDLEENRMTVELLPGLLEEESST